MDRRQFLTVALALPVMVMLRTEQKAADQVVIDQQSFLLQESPIAGFHYYDGELVFYDLYPGLALQLKREPSNYRDQNAIEIYCALGKLGYVPKSANTTLAQMMDQGVNLKAELTQLTESADSWEMARFKVWV
ncbi:MAG: HIRAN domain-containing protein [Immundisolibacteraceae bacterium]|nr:HIRAN domain-containing protein [Immundisolibacteraceae bacterium]